MYSVAELTSQCYGWLMHTFGYESEGVSLFDIDGCFHVKFHFWACTLYINYDR